MQLIYLDQNALIALGVRAREVEFRKKLDEFIAAHQDPFVLSLWNLVESSYGESPNNSQELADFIDSLRPKWLLERHQILALDVRESLYAYLGIGVPAPHRVVSRTEMFAALSRESGGPVFIGSLRRFVELWRKHRLEGAYIESARSCSRLQLAKKAGRVTTQGKMDAARALVRSVVPRLTPFGIEIPGATIREYVEGVDPLAIPSVALDLAISELEWAEQAKTGQERNAVIDKFHLVSALPYSDSIVSDDRFLGRAFDSVRTRPYVRAKLLRNNELVAAIEGTFGRQ